MTETVETAAYPCCGLAYHVWNCRNNPHRVESLRQKLLCELDWDEIGTVVDLTPAAIRAVLGEAVRRRVEAGF